MAIKWLLPCLVGLLLYWCSFVEARYPFQTFRYRETKGDAVHCGAITFLPYREEKDSKRRGKEIFKFPEKWNERQMGDELVGVCKHSSEKHYFFDYVEWNIMTEVAMACGKTKAVCDDLDNDISVNIYKLTEGSNTLQPWDPEEHYFEGMREVIEFTNKFEINREISDNIPETEMCHDRYGRKYYPIKALGGCMMIEIHDDGKNELFMPLETRDFFKAFYNRLSDFTWIENTIGRKKEECYVNVFKDKELLIRHCIYQPSSSHAFSNIPKDHYLCTVGEKFSMRSTSGKEPTPEKGQKSFFDIRGGKNIYFSQSCYARIKFQRVDQRLEDTKLLITLQTFNKSDENGIEKCNGKIVRSDSGPEVFQQVFVDMFEDICAWDLNPVYVICIDTSTTKYLNERANILDNVMKKYYTYFTDDCYYAVNKIAGTNGTCVWRYEPEINAVYSYTLELSRILFDLVQKAQPQHAALSSDGGVSGSRNGCFIIPTKQVFDSQKCLKKLKKTNATLAKIMNQPRSIAVCGCSTKFCDQIGSPDDSGYIWKLAEAHDPRLYLKAPYCFNGTDPNNLQSQFVFTYFCQMSVQPSIDDNRILNYAFGPSFIKSINLQLHGRCMPENIIQTNLNSHNWKNVSCKHDHDTGETYCCCVTTGEPCNKRKYLDKFRELESKSHHQATKGCTFEKNAKNSTILGDRQTCDSELIRNDPDMRCIAVYDFKAGSGSTITPKIEGEGCYWSQDERDRSIDRERIKVLCSNALYEREKSGECVKVVFENHQTTESKVANSRKIVLCCPTDAYEDAKKEMHSAKLYTLSREF